MKNEIEIPVGSCIIISAGGGGAKWKVCNDSWELIVKVYEE